MPMFEMPLTDPVHLVDLSRATAVIDRRRVALPVPLTRLVAREVEVETARSALLSPDVRLVTLTGPGGVGKSRVAIQTAWEAADAFAGDVHLYCLATLAEPGLLLANIARTLDLPDPGTTQPVAALQSQLLGRRALLVLDNFEQVLAAGPILAELLSACPDLKALVTSRERLRLRGEHVVRIPPLATPTEAETGDLDALQQNPSVRLLAQQAQEVVPDFRLTDDNAAAIAGIARRLEGLPLAIELAAARMVLFPPAELLNRLQRRLSLLSGGASDLPDRQRTMRDAIAWSYDLLAPDEQRLFRDLSIIANSYTLEAAEFIAGAGDAQGDAQSSGGDEDPGEEPSLARSEGAPWPPPLERISDSSVLDGVASLVDKSLLYQQQVCGETRYAMLEIIREFGLERLAACGEADAARQRHAALWLILAERAAADGIQHRDASIRLDRLELNKDDLRAALTWLEDARDSEGFLRLAAALVWFWRYRSHRTEGRRWLKQATDLARAVDLRTDVRARALAGAAVLAMTQGDYGEVRTFAAECLELSRKIDSVREAAAALNLLGAVVRAEREFARAAEVFTEALVLVQDQAAGEWKALALLNLGTVAYWQGDWEHGIALGAEAHAIFRQLDDDYGTAIALSDMALMASDGPDRARAAVLFRESLDAWRKVGTKEGLVEWLARVATLAITSRRTEAGVRLLGAVDRASETTGYRFEPPECALQERALAAAKSSVGAEAVATALEEGRRLSLEEAIATATDFLTELEEQPAKDEHPDTSAPYGLTPRELDVLRLLIDGRSDRQIGDVLCISHRTVMRHVEHILAKLRVESRTAAATQAVRLGLV